MEIWSESLTSDLHRRPLEELFLAPWLIAAAAEWDFINPESMATFSGEQESALE